jgi:hypothetical protein
MALGTLTVSASSGGAPSAPVFRDHVSMPGDSSYPTNGSAFLAAFQAAVGVKSARVIDAVHDVGGVAGHYPVYDKANGKLKIFVRTTGVEVANTTDLSATTFKLLVESH